MCCTTTESVQRALGSHLFYVYTGRTKRNSGKAEDTLLMGTTLSGATRVTGRLRASAGGMGAEGSRD